MECLILQLLSSWKYVYVDLNYFQLAVVKHIQLLKTVCFQTSSLQVLAIAGDRSSQATITVNIIDVNDNSPQFTENVGFYS